MRYFEKGTKLTSPTPADFAAAVQAKFNKGTVTMAEMKEVCLEKGYRIPSVVLEGAKGGRGKWDMAVAAGLQAKEKKPKAPKPAKPAKPKGDKGGKKKGGKGKAEGAPAAPKTRATSKSSGNARVDALLKQAQRSMDAVMPTSMVDAAIDTVLNKSK